MAFSIFEFDSFNNWAGDLDKENNLAEADAVTSSLVLRLIRQLTKTENGSFFLAITVTLGTGKPFTVFFSFLITSAMLKSPISPSICPQFGVFGQFLLVKKH